MQNSLNGLIDNLKMMYFMNARENNYYENLFIMFFIFAVTFIINNDNFYVILEKSIHSFTQYFRFLFPKCSIILEGKRCMKVTNYTTKTDNLFGDRFNAFWYYISKENLKNKSIYCLKEYANSSNIYDDYGEPKNNRRIRWNNNEESTNNEGDSELDFSSRDVFVVNQKTPFKLTKDIFCLVNTNYDRGDEKKCYDMENITIEIYSYKLSLKEIEKFIDDLHNDFKKSIQENRKNKKFIYTLVGSSDGNNNYDNGIKNLWEECEFKSNRNFNNLFFDSKKKLINKLNFFINNKEWYDYEGHPYTFGIGLHGPPGTGKTSVIKCIANKLNRNIIIIPLSKIKTQREFSEYFFEEYYTRNNRNKIDFSEKIIVFEDIDCMDDIVKNRKLKNKNKKDLDELDDITNKQGKDSEEQMSAEMKIQTQLLNKIAKKVDDDHIESVMVDIEKSKDDKITLSFILNIIDGIRETPGRILIITSNDYESLDPALVRPGRIDLTLEMNNASVDVIREMYNHYYGNIIPEEYDKKLKDYKISPAKIVNLRLENEKAEDFLISLLKEFEN